MVAISKLRQSRPLSGMAFATVLVASLLLKGPAHVIVALPIALLVPGWYSLPRARRVEYLDPALQAVLAVVLSLTVETVLAISLGLTAIGISQVSMTLALAGWIAVATLARTAAPHGLTTWRLIPRVELIGVLVVTASLVGGAVFILQHDDLTTSTPFTAVSLAGQYSAVARPIGVTGGAPFEVNINLENHTPRSQTYAISGVVGNARSTSYVSVSSGGTVTAPVSLTLPVAGCLERLTVSATPLDGSEAPRSVGLWLRWSDCAAATR